MGVYENGHIDFRNYDVTNRNWRKTNSFLEGNAGVGLMLLNSDYILEISFCRKGGATCSSDKL